MLKVATNNPPQSKMWKKIDLGGGNDFEVLLKRPVWEDLMVDRELTTDYLELRFEHCLLDWRGVADEQDQPIPYTMQTLRDLATVLPVMVYLIARELELLYAGITASAEKNLQTPPEDTSGAATSASAETTGIDTTPQSQPVIAGTTNDI